MSATSATKYDLVVRGGTLVIPGVGLVRADVGIAGDKIVSLGEDLSGPAAEIYDARGKMVLPGIFVRSLEESYMLHLPAFRRAMYELSYVDSVFHPQIFTEEQISEIPRYAAEFGIRSFKFYMSGMPGIVKSIPDDVLLQGFRTVAALGADAIACVH